MRALCLKTKGSVEEKSKKNHFRKVSFLLISYLKNQRIILLRALAYITSEFMSNYKHEILSSCPN